MDFIRIEFLKVDGPEAECINLGGRKCFNSAELLASLSNKKTRCCATASCKARAREWIYAEIGPEQLALLEARMRQEYEAALAARPASTRAPRTPTGGRKRKIVFAKHDMPSLKPFIP